MLQHIKYGLIICCLMGSWNSHAQFLKVDLSPKHQEKLGKTKDYKKKFSKYQKYRAKDSLKQAKKNLKAFKLKQDSLAKSDFQRLAVYEDLKDIEEQVCPDSSAVSFEYLKQVAEENGQIEELQKLKALEDQYGPYVAQRDSLLHRSVRLDSLLSQNDSTLLASGEELALASLAAYGGEGFAELGSPPAMTADQLMAIQGGHEQYMQQAKAYSSLATESMKNLETSSINELSLDQTKQVEATKSKMKVDKLKYAEIGDSNDMATAKKHQSLEGLPLKKRLFLGGNVHISSTDPVIFEMTPQIGYYINKNWNAGIGFLYKDSFGGDSTVHQQAQFGYNFFTSHTIYKSLFAYSEYNRLKRARLFHESDQVTEWSDAFLIGLGVNFKVTAKVDGHIMLLYDPNGYSPQRLFGLPVALKFGFKLSEIGRTKLFH